MATTWHGRNRRARARRLAPRLRARLMWRVWLHATASTYYECAARHGGPDARRLTLWATLESVYTAQALAWSAHPMRWGR